MISKNLIKVKYDVAACLDKLISDLIILSSRTHGFFDKVCAKTL